MDKLINPDTIRPFDSLRSRAVARDLVGDGSASGVGQGMGTAEPASHESMVTISVNAIAINVYRSVLRREKSTAVEVVRILEFCPPRDRSLLELQMQGATAHKIAQKHAVTLPAIRVRLLRARRDARFRGEKTDPAPPRRLASRSVGRWRVLTLTDSNHVWPGRVSGIFGRLTCRMTEV